MQTDGLVPIGSYYHVFRSEPYLKLAIRAKMNLYKLLEPHPPLESVELPVVVRHRHLGESRCVDEGDIQDIWAEHR